MARDVLHDRDGAFAHECDGHELERTPVACGAEGGVGGAQEVGNELTVSGPILCALDLPRHEASGVEMVFVQFG